MVIDARCIVQAGDWVHAYQVTHGHKHLHAMHSLRMSPPL